LVVTENSGLSEVLKQTPEECAVLVDPCDPADIARGLERLLGDKALWEEMRSRCQKLVLEDYTWESTGKDYLKVIKDIVAAPNDRRPDKVLLIHPYFRNPKTAFDLNVEDLNAMYFETAEVAAKAPEEKPE
jgi:sucrose-phosphate synthase